MCFVDLRGVLASPPRSIRASPVLFAAGLRYRNDTSVYRSMYVLALRLTEKFHKLCFSIPNGIPT